MARRKRSPIRCLRGVSAARDVVKWLAAVPLGRLRVEIPPVCGFPGWAGSPGCLVDVTLYLFLLVRGVIDQVRFAGRMGRYGIKTASPRDTPQTRVISGCSREPSHRARRLTSPAGKNPKSGAAAPLPRELLPAAAQAPLRALAVLAATATAAAAPAVRVREKRPPVSPGAAAGRAAAERVHPERYQVGDSEQDDQYDNPPHGSD